MTTRSSLACAHDITDLCVMPPAPELGDRLRERFNQLRENAGDLMTARLRAVEPEHVGYNDGLIFPGTYFPLGTTADVARKAAMERAPLSGTVRVAVVLVDFSDRQMGSGQIDRFRDLFFSTGVLPHGSVKEYFTDVSGGQITLDGEVKGTYRLPQTLATYAGSDNGTQSAQPNARTMANDALSAVDPDINLAPYDNDGNGYVDAFIVVHAGRGAEETGAAGDIWSHKWVLPAERSVDSTKVFGYLTIPEDAKIGVCAHELGHLLFGWPDLYDTDGTSEGIGNWCLMAGGSWGLGGDRPTHPSAWCKVNQGWANVVVQSTNATVTVTDVKTSRNVHRLWKDGTGGNEYFLLENRMQSGYDASLPGGGLLIWHIDEAVSTNRDENHPKVALMQADGLRQLENSVNRGDAGDCYPGTSGNTSFTDTSTPNSRSYAGMTTCVSVTGIPAAAPSMSVRLGVRCFVKPPKDIKEGGKETFKELRDKPLKDIRDGESKPVKDLRDGGGGGNKLLKDLRDGGGGGNKLLKDLRDGGGGKGFGPKEAKDIRELPGGGFRPPVTRGGAAETGGDSDLAARVAALEELVAALFGDGGQAGTSEQAQPFISAQERPDLTQAAQQPAYEEGDLNDVQTQMEAGHPEAKRYYDTLPPQ